MKHVLSSVYDKTKKSWTIIVYDDVKDIVMYKNPKDENSNTK